MLRRKAIKEVRRKAHLWAGALRGRKICLVNTVKNQVWEVKRRLFTHRLDGVGKRSHGTNMARRIRGIPNEVEEANWLNKSIVMVRFR